MRRAILLPLALLVASCQGGSSRPAAGDGDEEETPDTGVRSEDTRRPIQEPADAAVTPDGPRTQPPDGGGAEQTTAGGDVAGSTDAVPAGACEATVPERDPLAKPAAISGHNPAAVTALNNGDVDSAATNVLDASGGAGMARGPHDCGNQGTCQVWKWREAGAFLEYTVRATKTGSYGIVPMYYAKEAGGAADILVDGTRTGTITFLPNSVAGDYGGVPPRLSRGRAAPGQLELGVHKIRLELRGKVPVDVYGLQLNFAGLPLPELGKLHAVNTTASTTLAPNAVSDFYRMNFDPRSQTWPCQRSFCLIEYLVSVPRAGSYDIVLPYRSGNRCFQLVVNGTSVAPLLRVEPSSSATPPKRVELPCGINRIVVRGSSTFDASCQGTLQLGPAVLTPAR